MSTIPPARFVTVPDYYMPGREDMEPGTNALVNGGNGIIDGGSAGPPEQGAAGRDFFSEDGITFTDFLDVLNPLHHIPLIGEIYRAVSGDEISAGARLAGGTLYGGPLGFLSALTNTVVAEATGKDIGGNVVALFSGDGDGDDGVLVAGAGPAHDNRQMAGLVSDPAPWGQANEASIATAAAAPPAHSEAQASVPFGFALNLAPNGTTVPRSAVLAAGRTAPELSPAAFHTLLSNVNGMPKITLAQEHRLGLTAGGEAPMAHKGTIREAGLEINRLLRPHAEGHN